MALTKSIDTIKSKLGTIPVSTGQVIYLSDTEELYFDSSNGTRIQVRDLIILETEAERTAIIAPLTKLYYVKNERMLWVYSGVWMPLTSESVFVLDTRSENTLPDEYQDNGTRTIRWELKELSAIGLTANPAAIKNYAIVQTSVPWGDNSGGLVTQTAVVNTSGGVNIYTRQGSSSSAGTWDSWVRQTFFATESFANKLNWVKFSNGLIIQFGNINATSNVAYVTLPTAFPTSVKSILATCAYNIKNDMRVTATEYDNGTQIRFDINGYDVTADQPQQVNWLALGY